MVSPTVSFDGESPSVRVRGESGLVVSTGKGAERSGVVTGPGAPCGHVAKVWKPSGALGWLHRIPPPGGPLARLRVVLRAARSRKAVENGLAHRLPGQPTLQIVCDL